MYIYDVFKALLVSETSVSVFHSNLSNDINIENSSNMLKLQTEVDIVTSLSVAHLCHSENRSAVLHDVQILFPLFISLRVCF